MSDYISRQRLISSLSDWALQESPNAFVTNTELYSAYDMQGLLYNTIRDAITVAEEQPSADLRDELDNAYAHGYTAAEDDFRKADVQPVVRCKDCKDWYAGANKLYGYCRRECWEDDGKYRLKVETAHDDYCSYGEQKDG